ncbi:MAG: Lrp/AsnC family transcriptional regulator [Thermoproteota archaeon]|nr:Lrp/AsnC family transcriptional regulator [Thermoproteota archaeon]
MQRVDDLDLKLLSELKKNGNISVPVLSKKLEINSSVLYSRIKRLIRKKMIKRFTIEIDESQLGFQVKASVGINRDPKFKDLIHEELMKTPEVDHICEVTGRFDIIIGIIAKDLEQLHSVIIEKIGKIEGIQNTETFVELEKTDKEPVYLSKN